MVSLMLTGLLVTAVAACGGTPAQPPGGQPSPSGPAGGTHTSGSQGRCGAHVVAHDRDSGSTVCVIKGGDLIVMLRNPRGANWSSPHLTGRALGPAQPVPTPSGAVGWAFRAIAAGQAEISLTRPACPPASPGTVSCDAILLYHLHVKVRQQALPAALGPAGQPPA